MEDLLQLILFVVMIGAGYFSGTHIEKKHYQSIRDREAQTRHLPVVTAKSFLADGREIEKSYMVQGNVVVTTDFFKLFLAGLRNLFGGRLSAYETLLDRARREAVLRLKEMACGADIVLNMRLDTTFITGNGTVEVLAYGTAVHYKQA